MFVRYYTHISLSEFVSDDFFLIFFSCYFYLILIIIIIIGVDNTVELTCPYYFVSFDVLVHENTFFPLLFLSLSEVVNFFFCEFCFGNLF